MDPIYFHAKRVSARFLALVEIAKDETEEDSVRQEAYEMIANWPKTHTFCIKNDEDAVRVTWSKVFTGDCDTPADSFSKKEGKKVASEKMERLIVNPPRTLLSLEAYNEQQKKEWGEDTEDLSLKGFLFEHLPACVADTLPWYLGRAIRYFKIDDNKKVIIEGSSEKETVFHSISEQRKRIGLVVYAKDVTAL